MNNFEIQKDRWLKVLEVLGDEAKDFCAVGGGAVWLYLPKDFDPSILRPTEDVDFVVPAKTKAEFYKLDERLRQLGFKNDARQGAPLCRYVYSEITVDFMPVEEKVLNLSNRWYRRGLENRKTVELSDSQSVSIFRLAYYLASKFEAFQDRGKRDPRVSGDLEDICIILGSLQNFQELKAADDKELTEYLLGQLRDLATDALLREAVHGHLGDSKAANELLNKLSRLTGA